MNVSSYTPYATPVKVNRSFSPSSHSHSLPSGMGRRIQFGDKIFIRLEQARLGTRTLAEFTLTDVNDLSEIYGELRLRTRAYRGLARLYVRNISRGWSFQQPFMLYGDTSRPASAMAASVTRPVTQPERATSTASCRPIPESIRLLYGEH